MLAEIAKENSEAMEKIAKELYQEDGEQTRRMAATILANAFVFHETVVMPSPRGFGTLPLILKRSLQPVAARITANLT